VTDKRDISFWTLREIPPALEAIGRKTVAAGGLPERWFPLEFFRPADGRYVALEVTLRPPGGFMTDMRNYACDIDVYRLWARVVTGEPVTDFRYTPRYHVCHSARRATHRYQHGHAELVEKPGPALLLYQQLPAAYQSALGTEMYLTRHERLEDMRDAVRLIQRTAPG